jgi:hypothetical protein
MVKKGRGMDAVFLAIIPYSKRIAHPINYYQHHVSFFYLANQTPYQCLTNNGHDRGFSS